MQRYLFISIQTRISFGKCGYGWSQGPATEKYGCATYWHGEGFPGIFIDAFIAGLPVIATDWSMNGELIKDGKNGRLIPPHDPEALANTMEKVLADRETLKNMAKTCQETARLYDINHVIDNKLLEQLGLLNNN